MKPNVILIVCDSLRKDILRLYGGEAVTPNLERFSKDSMVYENCIAPGAWTFPSHVSLFTGMYANKHGIHETDKIKTEKLQDALRKLKVPRLPEQMQSEGYNTICISNNLMINRHAGFDYGFNTFEQIESSPWSQSKLVWEALELGSNPMRIFARLLSKGKFAEIAKYALEFIKIKKTEMETNYPIDKGSKKTNDMLEMTDLSRSFFLFINFWEMHEPYRGFSDKEFLDHISGIKPIDSSKIASLKSEYVREARFLDTQLGRFFEILKRRKLYDGSMIIITSDHGQEFNEHGYMYHGSQLHDEITMIPLIIKYPKSRKFKKRAGYQSLVNISRTVESVIHGGDDRELTSRTAFAEVYGNVEFIPGSMKYARKRIEERYDRPRKAVYMDGYKLVLDGSSGAVEEFSKDGKPIGKRSSPAMLKKLIGEIKEFKGKEAFKLPKS